VPARSTLARDIKVIHEVAGLLRDSVLLRAAQSCSVGDNATMYIGFECGQATEAGEITVHSPRGGALVMRPLLLHASSKATSPTHRRVLHVLFGPTDLPLGLEWAATVYSNARLQIKPLLKAGGRRKGHNDHGGGRLHLSNGRLS
jgi:hypothetical protein